MTVEDDRAAYQAWEEDLAEVLTGAAQPCDGALEALPEVVRPFFLSFDTPEELATFTESSRLQLAAVDADRVRARGDTSLAVVPIFACPSSSRLGASNVVSGPGVSSETPLALRVVNLDPSGPIHLGKGVHSDRIFDSDVWFRDEGVVQVGPQTTRTLIAHLPRRGLEPSLLLRASPEDEPVAGFRVHFDVRAQYRDDALPLPLTSVLWSGN